MVFFHTTKNKKANKKKNPRPEPLILNVSLKGFRIN